jgi:predicted NACHT family NTPase
LSANQLLNKEPFLQLVILGEPGSGKSMLIAYLVMKLVQNQHREIGLEEQKDWLPIPINIRDLAKQPETDLLKYIENFASNNLLIENLPKGFFEYWLSAGEALILLDGLDEVTDTVKRQEFSNKINSFLQDKKYCQNRIIITSRPAGYDKNLFGTAHLPHYYILRFDDDKINLFIDKWHNEQRFPDPTELEKCKRELKEALGLTETSSESTQKKRIKLLASNPLLLTIISLVHRYEAKELPQQRHKIYDSAVDTLLSARDIAKGIGNPQEKLENLQYLKLDDLKRLMERLAYWVHTQSKAGDKENTILIDRESMKEQLRQEIKDLKKSSIELYQAEQEARRFLDHISERTGLLNEQGQDCYAFVHKTFQEYLCAKEIHYQADNEDDFEIVLKHIRQHLYDPHWQEVMLLLIALQKPKKAARAIRAILDCNSEDHNKKQTKLLFAASCLAENPQNLISEDEELSSDILRDLIELEINQTASVSEEIRSQVFQAICDLRQTDFQQLAFKMLEEKANCLDPERWNQYRAIFEL